MFSIYGAQLGLWFSAASLIGLAFVMNYPAFEVVHYTSPQVSRFLITYSLMSAFLYIKEYFSEYGVQSLIKISNHHAKEANIDPLTGLPNRRFLDSIYFESARRSPFNYFPMSVAIVDLDSFKAVNDRLGHDVGDSVLQHTAKTLKQSLRNVDVVARTGGEEFLILLPKTEIKDAEKVIEKLRVVLHTSPMEDKSIMESLPSNLSFSAGIASVSSMDGMHDAIKAADKAMYKAKEHGRNRVEVADGEKI
jgi:diguanylate cyclase (GGDEF)-like protein